MPIISKIVLLISVFLFTIMIGITVMLVPIDVTNDDSERVNETEVEILTYNKLNQERTERKLDKLNSREDIEEISTYKTDRMISEDYISHYAPDGENVRDRFELYDVNCEIVGENLAKTYYDKKVDTDYNGNIEYNSNKELSEGIVKQFMNSPEHKDNLLDDRWVSHGLDIQINSNNEVYVTHKFCNN